MKLVQVLNEKLRQPTVKEIDDFLEYRANHVALVQRLGQLAFDMDFSDHDYDKITSKGRDFDLMVLRNASKTSNLKLNDEDKNELRKISAKHAKSQKHHPEYWDDEITIRNFQADDTNVIHATRMPYRWIAEMACDWAAVILYKNEDLFAWYNKVIDNTLIMTDGQKEFLAECLILLGKIIAKENIKYPGREYNAKLEEEVLPGARQFAFRNDLDQFELEKLLLRKIQQDWNLRIKKDTSNEYRLNFDVAPNSDDRNAPKQTALEFKNLKQRDPEVEAAYVDVSSTPTVQVDTKTLPEINKPLHIKMTLKPSTSSGASSYYVPSQEAMWCWFILCKINHKESRMPKNIEEVNNFDWVNTFGYDVDFKIPADWYEVFDKGSDELIKFLDPSSEYVGFRENTAIDTSAVGIPRLPAVHSNINKIADFAKFDRNLWNPSDIYLVKRDYVKTAANLALSFSLKKDIEGMNAFLKEGILTKNCVGISLKKIGAEIHAKLQNMDASDDAAEKFSVKSISFPAFDLQSSTGKISTLSEKDGDILTFTIQNGRVTTDLSKKNAREGANNLKEIFEEYNVSSKIEDNLEALINTRSLSISFGGRALRGYDIKVAWDKMQQLSRRPLNNKELEAKKAWYYLMRVANLLTVAFEKDGSLDAVLTKIRHACKKQGTKYAPYVLI